MSVNTGNRSQQTALWFVFSFRGRIKAKRRVQESFGAQVSSVLPHPGPLSRSGQADPWCHQSRGWSLGWLWDCSSSRQGLPDIQNLLPASTPFLHTLLSLGHRLCVRAWLVSIPSSSVVHGHVPLPPWDRFPSGGHQTLGGEQLHSPAVTAPSSSGCRCRWHRCAPGTARVGRAKSQPGLLQILLIHQPGRRGNLCLWHDGQGELPAGEERAEPQGILSKPRCKPHPVLERLRSPQHPHDRAAPRLMDSVTSKSAQEEVGDT